MFRETFLAHLDEEEDLRVLRHFGRMLYAWVLEFSHYGPDPREPLVRVALRAAAADLHHLAGYLADAALEPSPEWSEAVLVRQALRWARQVGDLAHDIEVEVEAPRQAVIPGFAIPAAGQRAGAPGGADRAKEEARAVLLARMTLRPNAHVLQQLVTRLQGLRDRLPLPPEPTCSQVLEAGDLDAYPALALAGDLDCFIDHLNRQAREMLRVAGVPDGGSVGEGASP